SSSCFWFGSRVSLTIAWESAEETVSVDNATTAKELRMARIIFCSGRGKGVNGRWSLVVGTWSTTDGIRWIGTGNRGPVLSLRDRPRDVVHEPSEPRSVFVLDVLRLISRLVIVLGIPEREVRHGHVVLDVVHLVAAAESVHRVGADVPRTVDGHRLGARRIHRVDDIAELTGEPSRPQRLDRGRAAELHLV